MKLAIFFAVILFNFIVAKRVKYSKNKCVNPSMDLIVKYLKGTKEIRSKAVEEIVCNIDRGDFLRNKTEPFGLEPVYIGYGATLSKPNAHVFAMEKALEKFKRHEKLKILDIGSGSGILAVYLKSLFPNSEIYGIEHIKELADKSRENISKFNKRLDTKKIHILNADGRKGLVEKQPFDYIHCGAAFKNHSIPLIKQLSKRGRLVAPVFDNPNNSDFQHIWVYDVQEDGSIKKQKGIDEAYVDMQNSENQRKRGKENIYIINTQSSEN